MEIKFKKVLKGNSDKRILLIEKRKDSITFKEYIDFALNELKKDNVKNAKAKKDFADSIVKMQNENALNSMIKK